MLIQLWLPLILVLGGTKILHKMNQRTLDILGKVHLELWSTLKRMTTDVNTFFHLLDPTKNHVLVLMFRLSKLLLLYHHMVYAYGAIYGTVACFGLLYRILVAALRIIEAVSEISRRKCVVVSRVWFVSLTDDSTSCVAT